MTSNVYTNILEQELLPAAYEIMGDSWILQQDNARPHTANYTYNFFEREDLIKYFIGHQILLILIQWRMENVWSILKKRVC